MRTIIAGSRDGIKRIDLDKALQECGWTPTVVISGMARGADTLGEDWANENGIPIEQYPADWASYGKSAGFIRNKEMANHAEALIALWDGESRGTRHMVACATVAGLLIHVHIVR
jgi:hypothetical protein